MKVTNSNGLQKSAWPVHSERHVVIEDDRRHAWGDRAGPDPEIGGDETARSCSLNLVADRIRPWVLAFAQDAGAHLQACLAEGPPQQRTRRKPVSIVVE